MKSSRTYFTISFLSVSLLIVTMLGISIMMGFFRIGSEWDKEITTDVTTLINNIIAAEFPDLEDLNKLEDDDLQILMTRVYAEYKGKLRSINFYSKNNRLIFSDNIKDIYDRPSEPFFHIEMLRWISITRMNTFHFTPGNSGILLSDEQKALGRVEIFSVPLMGSKYTGQFDRILTKSLLAGIILSVFISFVLSFLLSKRISRQTKTFATQLTMLANGNRKINFSYDSTTEMQSAASAAESLQRELQRHEEVQKKRLEDIIHDLKTPVSAIGIQFEAIEDGVLVLNNDRIKLLSTEFKQIKEMISELSKYTELTSDYYFPEPVILDANILIKETAQKFDIQAEIKKIQLHFDSHTVASLIKIDRIGFIRVLNNLIVNAVNNAPEETRIIISTSVHKSMITEQPILTVEIENEGKIEENDLPFLFDRLYRSKKSGYQGNGLGLAISKVIVEKNNGSIFALNSSHNSVIFRLELPAAVS